jgi:energy-coupling factor transport system permease protein
VIHPRLRAVTWLAWAIAAAACVEAAPSPVYVILVIGLAALAVERHGLDTPLARAFPLLVAAGVVFGLVRIVLAVTTSHGSGHVLATLPQGTLPRILGGFTVGGTIEAPVLARAAADSLAVVGVMAAFGAFNAVVSHHELVQSAPRAFHEPGLVLTVGLAFVPSTVSAIGAVREADRARTGNQVVKRGRLLRMTVPILETGMERAVALSESMDARGLARTAPTGATAVGGWTALGALLALAGAFVALISRSPQVALTLAFAGALGIAAAVALASVGTRQVRYRRLRLTPLDWLVIAVAVASPIVLGIIGHRDTSLVWDAEALRVPAFHLLPALALVGLALPLTMAARGGRSRDEAGGSTP